MNDRWKKVEEFASQDRPESALKEVEAILAQAKKEKNSSQIIKATINRMRFITDKNPDETLPLLKEFEDYADKSTDAAEKAVMHTMTAKLYNDYYNNNRWNIDRRTELQGIVPEDIKEWTKNLFVNKIVEQLNLAMQNPSVLQKTDALKYAEILEQGKDGREMQPTLFDFLAYQQIGLLKNFADSNVDVEQINLLSADAKTSSDNYDKNIKTKISDIYNQIIDFNKQKNNTPATVYAELQKLQFENPAQDEKYLEELKKLEKKYADNEAVVEVLAEKAQYFLGKANEENGKKTYRAQAYHIAQESINRFPKYKRVGLLKNIQNDILQKNIHIQTNTAAKPNSELKINIASTNIDALQLSVYKVNAATIDYLTHRLNRRNNKKLYPKATLVESKTVLPKKSDNFSQTDTVISIKTTDYGIYELVVEEKGNTNPDKQAVSGFTVTDLAMVQRANANRRPRNNRNALSINEDGTPAAKNLGELYLLDRASGKPYNDAAISVYKQNWNGDKYSYIFQNKITAKSDNKYLIPSNSDYNDIAVFERGNDKYFTSQTYNYWHGNSRETDAQTQVALFTDRSIYRPSQTVYFKGIAYLSSKNKQEVVCNQSFEVNLYNANGEKINTKKLTSNEFGSFAGEFILPESGLNGAYRLETGNQSINIWVEEYKRPTFEVTLDRPKDEVRFGEEVSVKGNVKAYAGYNINNADVKYRVVRRPHRFWWWHSEPEKIVVTETAKSDNEGNFTVKFTPAKDKNAAQTPIWRDKESGTFYTYYVYADVTDPKGETQKGEQTLSVGDKALFILAQMPEKVDKTEPFSLDVTTQTLNGETVVSEIKYSVISLKNSEEYYEKIDDKTVWKETGTVLSGKISTKDKLALDLKKLPSGMYKIVFSTKDNRGNEVKSENRFILFDKNDKRPPVKVYTWLLPVKTDVNVGEKAQINFGTSAKNTFVLYELMNGSTVLESRWIEMNDEIRTFEVPFKAEYGAGVTAQFTFIKDEQFFTKSVQITRKVAEKKLTPTVSVFRDKLQPGEKAEWTINIPETAKDKKAAELLVGMYDASLDALRPHAWTFDPTYREYVKAVPRWTAKGFETDDDAVWFEQTSANTPDFQFDNFNWFGLNMGGENNWYGGRQMRIRGLGKAKNESVAEENMAFATVQLADTKGTAEETGVVLKSTVNFTAPVVAKDEEINDVKTQTPPPIRTNFNETAFFYPQLRTDDKGNVKIAFTAPESLTKWHVKMLAHTQDLYFGQNETFAVTQKELMVQMNLPRFVRRSDKLTLVANVVNLSDEPLTPKVILEIDNQAPQPPKGGVVIRPKETVAYSWELPEMKDLDLVVVKITAQTDKFSDGEQRYLPVLPDKVLITESQTMTLRAGQTRVFSFDSFIKNLKNVDTKNFTVEYAGNPAWYAVQALPSVAAPASENAIDYLTAYYANTLGSYIANANPALKSTFEKWKNKDKNALLSNLEKNQELKNMLLEETPWVNEAKDETEQKRQIALLFDLNQTQNKAATYWEKLSQLQLPSGGFAWFQGMPESRYITQEILLHLARLNKMTGGDVRAKNLSPVRANDDSFVRANNDSPLTNALKYLDLQIAKDFFELKKWNKDYQKQQTINNLQLFYLHTRSEYKDIPIEKSAVEAVNYYTAQSEKYWQSWTLYGRAMMAVVAQRNGKTQLADQILTSIRENAMKTDELGMYWAKNTAGWWWHERPIAVQTAIMEAFNEIRKSPSDIDEMKIWLLKQKQTQRWDTPISTLDAIYALLNYGTDWLTSKGDAVITLGSTKLKPQDVESGTAYFKQTVPTVALTPEMGKITVTSKSASGISWGAAYWQYYQDVDKVQSQGKEMKISKKLFVERVTNQGKSMLPIEQTALKKGDKVITRLVVTTDRDLEFVALKDLRAACFEPVNQLSGTAWKEGTIYYQTTKDASTQFFFQFLPKGTYVFEYELWVNNTGTYSSGMAEIQCHYAPEFTAHTGGERIVVQ